MANRAWCRCSRKTCWPNSASSPASIAMACASPATCARARAPWTSSSSRCCRIRRWSSSARARSRCRSPPRHGNWAITSRSPPPPADLAAAPDADMLVDGFALGELHQARRFIVISTQGRGDEVALRAALGARGGLCRLCRQPAQDGGAARKARSPAASPRWRSIASRPRPGSISAPSRRRKSQCRSSPKSPSSAAAVSVSRRKPPMTTIA